jgi:Acetokinase family
MCAIKDGRSVATTMGFTAVDGLMMGTRCGAIDPGEILYMMQEHGLGAAAIEDPIYRQSGLLGVSCISSRAAHRTRYDGGFVVTATLIVLVTSMLALSRRTNCPDDHAVTDIEAFTNIDLTIVRLPDRYGRDFTACVGAIIPMKPSVQACDRSRRGRFVLKDVEKDRISRRRHRELEPDRHSVPAKRGASLGGWKSAPS